MVICYSNLKKQITNKLKEKKKRKERKLKTSEFSIFKFKLFKNFMAIKPLIYGEAA